jgi:hypothetical protein
MDDIGPAPYEAAQIEVWINRQLRKAQSPEAIADELIKKWESHLFSVSIKSIVARFCLLNNFSPSLIRLLKTDLRLGQPLPWHYVFEILNNSSGDEIAKELVDALLAGATRDKQLLELSASALGHGAKDPRWMKILESELKEKNLRVQEEKDKLYKELRIYLSERMDAEVAQALTRILTLFPNDSEAQKLSEKLGDKELEAKIVKLKDSYDAPAPHYREAPDHWPELDSKLPEIQKGLSLEQTYLLSIALFQMNLIDLALASLREKQDQWTTREKLFEIELLISLGAYAEALGSAQIILGGHPSESDTVKGALYYMSLAYHGLGDTEQAITILQGILAHDPHYRDASILLVEWRQ